MSAAWIWCDPHGSDRNCFALFRCAFELADRPERAELRLFADARWRLRVRGEIVAYGPSRFHPACPEFDTLDLAPWLRRGQNVVVVEAWAPNASSFQAAPSSVGGFIAWGEVRVGGRTIDLATPGSWVCRRGDAWDPLAPAFSFAQGPAEIVDLARLPHSWFTAADPAGWSEPSLRRDGPWGEPTPRRGAPFTSRLHRPARLALIAALEDAEDRVSCRRHLHETRRKGIEKPRYAYAVTITAPHETETELAIFWGRNWLNGAELKPANDALRGSRQNIAVRLKQGANLLYGELDQLMSVWTHYVAVPRAAGLTLGALRATEVIDAAELERLRGEVPASPPDLARLPFAPDESRPSRIGVSPARDVAWDRPARVLERDVAVRLPLALEPTPEGAGWAIVADFGGPFSGHLRVEVEAPAGTVLDVGFADALRSDGLIATLATHVVEAVERVILSGGRETVELFHVHGGRWLQLCLRPPAGGVATIHALAVRDQQTPIARDGEFACSDPTLNSVWEGARRRLQIVTEDVINADPLRERHLAMADQHTQIAALAAVTRDLAPAKRAVGLWPPSRDANGLMPFCVPAWGFPPDFQWNLQWIRLLHLVWRHDGDAAPAARWWTVIADILDTATRERGSDLWDLSGGIMVLGGESEDASGQANAVFNSLRFDALRGAADLARALGRDGDAARFGTEASRVAALYRERLWLPQERRFARRLVDGKADAGGSALHANALALAWDIAAPEQVPGALAHLERVVEPAFAKRLAGAERTGACFLLPTALEPLYHCGRAALAEDLLRRVYAPSAATGGWFAWMASAIPWFGERILGVRPERVGDWSRMLVAPDSTLEWAEGAVPHPRGIVRVSWRRSGGRLEIGASAPPGVELRIVPGPAFADLRVVARGGHCGPAASAIMRA